MNSLTAYDKKSIMQFDGTLRGLFPIPVITDKITGKSIEVNRKLSSLDIVRLNKMYPCESDYSSAKIGLEPIYDLSKRYVKEVKASRKQNVSMELPYWNYFDNYEHLLSNLQGTYETFMNFQAKSYLQIFREVIIVAQVYYLRPHLPCFVSIFGKNARIQWIFSSYSVGRVFTGESMPRNK